MLEKFSLGPLYWGHMMRNKPLLLWLPGQWDRVFADCTMPGEDFEMDTFHL